MIPVYGFRNDSYAIYIVGSFASFSIKSHLQEFKVNLLNV